MRVAVDVDGRGCGCKCGGQCGGQPAQHCHAKEHSSRSTTVIWKVAHGTAASGVSSWMFLFLFLFRFMWKPTDGLGCVARHVAVASVTASHLGSRRVTICLVDSLLAFLGIPSSISNYEWQLQYNLDAKSMQPR